MGAPYHEYLVNTPDITRTKQEIRDRLHEAASILLTVSSYEHGESSTREITYFPEEVPTTGFIFSRGVIQPDNTEASIVEEDDKYLVLVASIDTDH